MKNKILITLTLISTVAAMTACGTTTIEKNEGKNNIPIEQTVNGNDIISEATQTKTIENNETETIEDTTEINEEETTKEEIEETTPGTEEPVETEKPVEDSPKVEETTETLEPEKDVASEITFDVEDVNKTMYSTTSLNVRELPDAKSNKLGVYSLNNEVKVTGICDNGWARVNYNGATAYVKAGYLSDNKVEIPKPPAQNPVPETNNEEPTPSAPTVVVGKEGTFDESKAKEAFDLVNQVRISNGLSALTWDSALVAPAKTRATEASIKWSHTRPDGSAWYTVAGNIQGENLAKGYDSAQDAVNAWMASQGHKENILRGSFTRGAIAFFSTENGWFWCQAFGY